MRHLRYHPPVQAMIQAFLGIKVPPKPPRPEPRPKKDFDAVWAEAEAQFADVPDV